MEGKCLSACTILVDFIAKANKRVCVYGNTKPGVHRAHEGTSGPAMGDERLYQYADTGIQRWIEDQGGYPQSLSLSTCRRRWSPKHTEGVPDG